MEKHGDHIYKEAKPTKAHSSEWQDHDDQLPWTRGQRIS